MTIKVNFCQKIELSVLLFLPQKKSIYRFQKSIYRFPVNTVTHMCVEKVIRNGVSSEDFGA